MNRVIHFEIGADDPERAMKFYGEVFGWEFKKWEEGEGEVDYWTVTTGPESEMGINGGLSKRREPLSQGGINGFTNSIGVDNIDEYSRKIEQAGGKITAAKMPVAKMGWFAEALDTEGNTFGIFEENEQNK